MPSFIETQFPIARLSAESYKERKANNGQTLTRLGKWWGRKPLILIRASILGMLMPASPDAKRDREVFLKILTMDDAGTLARWRQDKRFADPDLAALATAQEKADWEHFQRLWEEASGQLGQLRSEWRTVSKADKARRQQIQSAIESASEESSRRLASLARFKDELQTRCFQRVTYPERIARCDRPENVEGPSPEAWAEINAHLDTTATSLPELVKQLGQRTFGHTPRVGDAFCGGGSIPFEAARIGCEAFGSDLNPVAALLTWASLNLLGGGPEVQEEVMRVQAEVLSEANRQVTAWGIEHNEAGERADAYLYCVEVKPEGCAYYIPLAPSWLVGERSRVVCRWHRVPGSDRLHPEVATVSEAEVEAYKEQKGATVVDSRVIDPFDSNSTWSVESLRGAEGLRRWTHDDLVPRPGDVFQERLYCIRWVKTVTLPDGTVEETRRYAAPDAADLERETQALTLLRERFAEWQRLGLIPSIQIPEGGAETDRLFRERGWTHWHHLFTPRQLLTHGLLAEISGRVAKTREAQIGCLLGLGRTANFDSRLCRWIADAAREQGSDVFANQALNSNFSYTVRPLPKIASAWKISFLALNMGSFRASVVTIDARDIRETCDLWVTDPPYADAVNYHELADFFLAWYDKQLARAFPDWTPDARAELAVRGDGEDFRRSMVEIYKNLAHHMPDNGLQMVQFTHQDPGVWADLGMILWAAGLKATAAWTISTETEAVGIKKGNYVTGTVCLVLRKRVSPEPGFLDEVYPLVEDEVRRQIASMQALDEDGEPNFNDADYQLAAYAAALKVLTQYGTLDGREVEHEVFAVRDRDTKSEFQKVIERAITIACDLLIPRGLDALWRDLSLVERYYLRALDIESRGERRKGMYEELARGFGVTDIRPLLKSDKANGVRMHTASDFAASHLAQAGTAGAVGSGALTARRGRSTSAAAHPFAVSPLRHLLFAIRETAATDNSPEAGRQYLRDTFGQGYWSQRERFVGLLDWLAALGNAEGTAEWATDSEAARILAGRLRNDHA